MELSRRETLAIACSSLTAATWTRTTWCWPWEIPAPADLPGTENLQHQYISDPWAHPLTYAPNETVLLVGTGLTMVDVATAAAASSKEQIVIHSISRHGLLPPSQTQFSHAACKGDSAAILRAASFSALTLLRAVRELAEQTERRGGDWREAVTFIRNIAPALWQRLPAREKRRMLRHIRPYWDVHRHRVPSETLGEAEPPPGAAETARTCRTAAEL